MLPRQPTTTVLHAKAARKRPVPRFWLMTDARLGSRIPAIIAHMPPRSAIVIRPQALARWGSAAHIRRYARIARAKRHALVVTAAAHATDVSARTAGRPDALHITRHARLYGRGSATDTVWRSMAVHDAAQAARARRLSVDAILVSPVWPTMSHVAATPVGLRAIGRHARAFAGAVIALGGVAHANAHLARRHGATGWAAIDAWKATDQNRY